MTGSAQIKYTDRDVRSNLPWFEQQAVAYVMAYAGEFDFLIACRELYQTTGELPVPMVRGVLNCMRADPFFRGQLPVPLEVSVPTPMLSIIQGGGRPPRKFKLPPFVRVKARWKCDYVYSAHPSAWIYHFLLPDPGARWWREKNEMEFHMGIMCSAQLSSFNLTIAFDPPDGYEPCKRCMGLEAEWQQRALAEGLLR